jgi:hypothetical protein
MRSELALGIVGGLLAIIFTFIGLFLYPILVIFSMESVGDPNFIAGLAWSGIFGSVFSIVGGAIESKPKVGGAIMLIGAILVLVSLLGSLSYILNIVPFTLILIGSILAFSRKQKIVAAPPLIQPLIPTQLPSDLSRAEYAILRAVREGIAKPKDIAKYLVTDKKEVEIEIEKLKLKGYLSKDGKLTSKGLETVQQ